RPLMSICHEFSLSQKFETKPRHHLGGKKNERPSSFRRKAVPAFLGPPQRLIAASDFSVNNNSRPIFQSGQAHAHVCDESIQRFQWIGFRLSRNLATAPPVDRRPYEPSRYRHRPLLPAGK